MALFLALTGTVMASPEPISADQAFQFSATAKNYQTILVMWNIAPNYYLYQQHFSFRVLKPTGVTLGNPLYPSNTQPLKTGLGTFQVYTGSLVIPLPIIQSNEKSLVLQVKYQGCSKAGYCYPPMTKVVPINLAANFMQSVSGLAIDVAPTLTTEAPQQTEHTYLSTLLDNHSFFLMILGFLGFGVLLSLTPCVLPMIPILSSMIIGREKMSHTHSFLLSLFYVAGMAVTYAFIGVIFGLLGSNIQIIFQKPWIIIAFSLLFVLMALSLFGLFQLQLPEKLRSKIASTNYHQKSGTYFGAVIMGILSTLILSPCVTPPLVAALGFISQSGSAFQGGVALFAMGIGMGAPLLLIGALGPKILPKSGNWMNTIKNLMGILLLAIAIFMVQRVLPGHITLLLWAGLSLGTAIYFGALSSAQSTMLLIKKSIGIVFFVYGILLMVGAYHGITNPLDVLKMPSALCETKSTPQFLAVQSIDSVQQAITRAPPSKIVMLDFSADWCIACKEFETFTLQNASVQQALSGMVLLRADITKNSADDQLLMLKFNVIAPPTILFFKDGQEIPKSRIIGFKPAKLFLKHIANI